MSMETSAKRAVFRKLHESGHFVIPNPWDIGSAKILQHIGFKALATTSAGFAFSRGLPDDPAALAEGSERRLCEMEAGQDVRLVGHG